MKQNTTTYSQGMLDILGILDETANQIEKETPTEKQFNQLKTAIEIAYGHVHDFHIRKVRDNIGLTPKTLMLEHKQQTETNA